MLTTVSLSKIWQKITALEGAVFVANYSAVNIKKSSLYDNSAFLAGGAVAAYVSLNISITNSTFTLTEAHVTGGAIYAAVHSRVKLSDSVFSTNFVRDEAYAHLNQGGAVTISLYTTLESTNVTFKENMVHTIGGEYLQTA